MENLKNTIKKFFQNRGNKYYKVNEITRRFPPITEKIIEKLGEEEILLTRNIRGFKECKLKKPKNE